MNELFFDTETCPCSVWCWKTGKQYVSADQILEPTRIICISYKWSNKKPVSLQWDKFQDDAKLLVEFSKVAEQADVLIGHNGKAFDIKHINARLAYHNLFPLNVVSIEDTLQLSRSTFNLPSHSLNSLAKYFKLGEKLPTGGIDLWLKTWKNNDRKSLDKMARYCNHDVVLLEKVYKKILPFVKMRKNLSVYFENNTICPSCAGKLSKHGIRCSGLQKYQRYFCKDCGKTFKSGINLLANSRSYPRN